MKRIYSITVAALLASCGFIAAHASHAQSDTKPVAVVLEKATKQGGQEMVKTIRQGFEAGEYQSFLAGLDTSYQQVVNEGRFGEFMQMRQMPPTDKALDQAAARFETLHQELVAQRNLQLNAVCQGQSDPLCAQVHSAILQLPKDQNDALKYIMSLRFKTPESATSVDEKQLIEIDAASEYKIVHLDAQYAAKPFEDRVQKHLIVQMDMLRQMKAASQSFSDEALKQKVEIASDAFDAWAARNWDMHQINQATKKPSTDLEKKINSILTSHKNKKDDLYQKEYLEKVDPK